MHWPVNRTRDLSITPKLFKILSAKTLRGRGKAGTCVGWAPLSTRGYAPAVSQGIVAMRFTFDMVFNNHFTAHLLPSPIKEFENRPNIIEVVVTKQEQQRNA